MKKSIALLFAGALVTGFAFAGGIENKTNMSTGYLRNPSRNVEAERPEASFYNIAGTGFMEKGLHIEAGNQFIFKEYSNTIATNVKDPSSGAVLVKDGTKSNDETIVWFYPNIDIVYKWNNFAFFGNFGIYAGGGKLEYSEGTSVTALAFLRKAGDYKAQALAAQTAAANLTGAAQTAYAAAAQTAGSAAANLLAAGQNHSLTISSITYGEQIGLAYNLFDLVSLSAAVRFLQGDQKLTLESPYFNAISGEGNEVSCKSFAFGVSPVFGAHVRLFEKLDIAAQLQVITKMKYEVNSVTGKKIAAQIGDNGITEDTTFHSDIPTALNLGVGYRVIEPLYLSTSFNYYFNKSADCDSVIGTNSYDDSFEIALGADYKINDFVLVSGGFAYGKQGTTSSANNVFNPILDSFQIGLGTEITPIKLLKITAGATYVKYFETEYKVKDIYPVDLNKNLFMFALSATVKLF